ncbi:BAG domain containing protein, putative [Angomonas deanei]|uniref:BAG domain containing protein, putative n=1 Tax=Angomonas deanei TaxID=59799 RepID=A0A7G2CM01_9TRYP|nr:BAG domain containing protein, putative [Angomonas deanei]
MPVNKPVLIGTAAAAVACLAFFSALVRRHHKNDDSDDFVFADPKETNFLVYMNKLEKNVGTHLKQKIAELEKVAQEEGATDDEAYWSKVKPLAVTADELLTQYICKLDGVPVQGQEELKAKRKELVNETHELAAKIAPYLHKNSAI